MTINPQNPIPDPLMEHVCGCQTCLFALAKQRAPLTESGCATLRALLFSVGDESPLRELHFTEEIMENFHFRRLNRLEKKVFDAHRISCDACEAALHNELLFIYAMQAALESDPHLYRNRSGAQFKTKAAAA